jgi:hypothetical protein
MLFDRVTRIEVKLVRNYDFILNLKHKQNFILFKGQIVP